MKIFKSALTGIAFLALAALVAFFTLMPGLLEQQANKIAGDAGSEPDAVSLALHDTLVIADLHADTTLWSRSLLGHADRGHVDIPRMLKGNIALQMFTTVTKSPKGQNYDTNSAESPDVISLLALAQRWPIETRDSLTARALHQASRLEEAAQSSESFVLVTSKGELASLLAERARGTQIIGGLLGTEGSHALDGKLANIDTLYEAGFRMMSLQHFFDNKLGGSLHGLSNAGLTVFGEQAVDKMVAKGIMIDVSHSSEQVVLDVLARTTVPLIVSHTGLKGHCDSKRNISDETMHLVAERGGIIGIGFWDAAVCEESIYAIVDALRYGIDTFGLEHIALGSDWDGAVTAPIDVANLARLTHGLVQAGFSEREIRAVMGENIVAFFKEHLPD